MRQVYWSYSGVERTHHQNKKTNKKNASEKIEAPFTEARVKYTEDTVL